MKLVVDASVAVKWFFAENFNREADRLLLENFELCAPDFMLLEIASILWKKWRRGELHPQDDATTLMIIRDIFKEWVSTFLLADRALELAKELDHSVYDCAYLATAERQRALLITADHRFYNRVKASPYSEWILWIEDSIREK